MDLKIAEIPTAGWTRLEVQGEVDLHTATQLKDELLRVIERGDRFVAVDLCGVDFLDSSGLGALVAALKRLREGAGSLAIVCAEGPVRKVFTITALDAAFPMFDSPESLPPADAN